MNVSGGHGASASGADYSRSNGGHRIGEHGGKLLGCLWSVCSGLELFDDGDNYIVLDTLGVDFSVRSDFRRLWRGIGSLRYGPRLLLLDYRLHLFCRLNLGSI